MNVKHKGYKFEHKVFMKYNGYTRTLVEKFSLYLYTDKNLLFTPESSTKRKRTTTPLHHTTSPNYIPKSSINPSVKIKGQTGERIYTLELVQRTGDTKRQRVDILPS